MFQHYEIIIQMSEKINPIMRNSGIVVATSIPPKVIRCENGRDIGEAYQSHCIKSWIDAGFRVLSLNAPEEISELARRYPKVQFFAIKHDDSGTPERRGPLLTDLLSLLARQKEDIVGIVNADIVLEAKDWAGAISAAVKGAIAVAHRVDVKSFENPNPTIYLRGYDLFFFERKEVPAGINRPFAMGLPWWDYYLPVALGLRGLRISLLTAPIAFHLEHPQNYNTPTWRYMARQFAEFVIESVAAKQGSYARKFSPIIRLAQKVAAGPAVFEDIQPSLVAEAWFRSLAKIRRLQVLCGLPDLISERYGQDTNQLRLMKACISTISDSTLITLGNVPADTSILSLPFFL